MAKREKIFQYLCDGTNGWRLLGVRRHFCCFVLSFLVRLALEHIIAYCARMTSDTRAHNDVDNDDDDDVDNCSGKQNDDDGDDDGDDDNDDDDDELGQML